MHTYFLGQEEVIAYAQDFISRLIKEGDSFPYTWFPIGLSGHILADLIYKTVLPEEYKSKIKVILTNYTLNEVAFQEDIDKTVFADGKTVLLLDSSVHSGTTMLNVFKKLTTLGAEKICSYSLIIKQNTSFVPTFFGVLIQPSDRAYFLLNQIPNNRIRKNSKMPFGTLRKICNEDSRRQPDRLNSSHKSMNEYTWASLCYEHNTKGSHIYVYEYAQTIIGFIIFTIKDNRLFIDGIAVDKNWESRGIGGALLRWAETIARSSCCNCIELWAIQNRIGFYQKKGGFELTQKELFFDPDHTYKLMCRKLLYNLDSVQ